MAKAKALDVVLFVRRRAEEQAERALAEAALQVKQAQAELEQVQTELTHAVHHPSGAAGMLLETVALQWREQRVRDLRVLREQAQQILRAAEQMLTTQQAIYFTERRRRETVDSLQQQRRQQERMEQLKRETKLAEDLFLGRLGRRTSEST